MSDPYVRALIVASIDKWKANVKSAQQGLPISTSPGGCPLCERFNSICNVHVKVNCEGCPIKEMTGKPICQDTPYWDVVALSHYQDSADGICEIDLRQNLEQACQRNVDFLGRVLYYHDKVTS